MIDSRGIDQWLRQKARERLARNKEPQRDEDGVIIATDDVLKGGEGECPSCGMTEGRHAYYCAVAYPEED